MKYRNAFAHGNIVNKQNKYFLNYFDQKLVVQELNDEFWNKIEESFLGSFNCLLEIETALQHKDKT